MRAFKSRANPQAGLSWKCKEDDDDTLRVVSGYTAQHPVTTTPCRMLLPQALHAADKVFGSDTNSKGFKVIRGCGVIQGDGIDITVMEKVCCRRIAVFHWVVPAFRLDSLPRSWMLCD